VCAVCVGVCVGVYVGVCVGVCVCTCVHYVHADVLDYPFQVPNYHNAVIVARHPGVTYR